MKEDEVIASLADFSSRAAVEVKGLSGNVVWILYGAERDYVRGGSDGKEWDKGLVPAAKSRPDWEVYTLVNGAGALQTHLTGLAEKGTGGSYTGKPEELKRVGFIHQLLPNHLGSIKGKADFKYTALNARAALLNSEPARAGAILFFQMYLRSIYRAVSGANETILLQLLESIPGKQEPAKLLATWQKVDERIKAEQPNSSYEIKNGRFAVYLKEGKKKILVNGWMFGEDEAKEEESPDESDAEKPRSDYTRKAETFGFHLKMNALNREAEALFGEGAEDLISLAAAHKAGVVARVLESVQKFTDLAESNMLQPAHAEPARALLDQLDRFVAATKKNTRLLKGLGVDLEGIKTQSVNAQKLRRKI